MMMPFATTNEGFSAFVAIGLKWPGRTASQGDVRAGLTRSAMLAQPVIDVDAQPGESHDSFAPPFRFQEPDRRQNESMPRAYGLPDGPSQAPRLLYVTSCPGQMIDVYV